MTVVVTINAAYQRFITKDPAYKIRTPPEFGSELYPGYAIN